MGKKSQTAKSQAAAEMQAVNHSSKISKLEAIIDYVFANKKFAWEALQLPGNGFHTPSVPNGNKRLAIVGDMVIYMILVPQWHSSGEPRGTWTAISQSKTSNKSLGHIGEKIGLEDCIQKSLTNHQVFSNEMSATAVEAVIGAVYLDCKDLDVVEKVVKKMGISDDEAAAE